MENGNNDEEQKELSNDSVHSAMSTPSEELDSDATTITGNTMGLRSPGGPLRGRSVKEFEEQLTNLKKENFNLKLRIYFLEEKMGTNFTLDKDNIVKKYIELQVDFANLKREMEEKQELLCQAVKAMELEDDEHKKYLSEKEEQIVTYQQEIEDLRVQLQDVKSDSEGTSTKSDTTGLSSGRLCGTLVTELQEKVKFLENELHLEKETNASYQLIIGQTETLKKRYESLLNENQAKEESIRQLRQENELSNSRIQNFTEQIKNFQDKLNLIYQENQSINKRLIEENKMYDELSEHYQELKKKYSNVKTELEREHQKSERVKYAGETRVSDLEGENDKLKHILSETQGKLETALTEIRKNQNLAVSKSLLLKSNTSHTDAACVSVQNTTTPTGTPQKDPLHVQVVSSTTSGALKSSSSVSIVSLSSSPDKFNNIDLEDLLANADHDKILSVINSIKYDYETQRQKVLKLKAEQLKACEIIKNMIDSRNKANEEIQQYQVQVKNLERELESVVSKPTSDRDSPVSLRERVSRANEKLLEESKSEEKKMAELYRDFTTELENKIEVLEATIKEKDNHIQAIRDQYDDLLNNLEEKEQKILQLENDLMSTSSGVSIDIPSSEKGDTATEKRSKFYKTEIEEKDREISRLTAELKKCSCYLQEIVNKELWEKNKEIEKLHCRQVNSPEILKLRKDLTGKEQQLKLLKEKISELGLDMKIMHELDLKDVSSPTKFIAKSLQDELKTVKDERDYFKNRVLELELTSSPELIDTLRAQLEKSENHLQESNEVCVLLNTRLQELAIFLDSLLKQKSVLGFLGIHKEKKLREIINNSLDLSKSFNMSIDLNHDESLRQLSNITSILNGSGFKDLFQNDRQDADDSYEMLSIIPGNVTLTYQSHLYKQKNKSQMDGDEVLTALRSQIVNLKSELQLRDIELSRLNANVKLSETDEEQKLNKYAKELSKVTVTPNKNNTTSATLNYQSECASESEGWSEPDRVVSRARIGLSQSLPLSPTAKTIRSGESTDDDNLSVSALYHKHQEIERCQEAIDLKAELEKKTEQLEAAEQKLLNVVATEVYEEVKNNLLEAEGRAINQEMLRIEAENYIKILKEEIDGLTQLQEELKRDFEVKDEQIQNLFKQLEAEKARSQKISAKLEEVVDNSKKQQIVFECKEKDFNLLENQLQKDLLEISVQLEEEQNKLKDMQAETIEKMKEIEDSYEHRVKEIKTYYNDNYLNKSEVESKLAFKNQLIQEFEDLKEMVKTYENAIQVHKNKELDYENNVCEYQEKVNTLRKELDLVNLEHSDAVLQKNRLANDKTILEQELSRCNGKELELRQQINEIRSEIDTISQNYQQEVSLLQKQKSDLQMKISILESNNASLHNRLIRNQESRQDFSSTGTNMRIETGGSFNRQFSHSSFNSEENLQECSGCNVNASIASNRQPVVDTERQEANASPDLGIESDQGRFSSLELHTNITRRPLLQTLELTQSMNNMLDDNSVRNDMCDSQHCCQRTLDIAQENMDLKRKLLRMRRAVEEITNQLNLTNQRKKEVEKSVCKQIHKTNQVLRKAKDNLDSKLQKLDN